MESRLLTGIALFDCRVYVRKTILGGPLVRYAVRRGPPESNVSPQSTHVYVVGQCRILLR